MKKKYRSIKGCPHCGGESHLRSKYSYQCSCYFVFVKCSVCGAQGKTFGTNENPEEHDWNTKICNDAIGAWNMRIAE